jgi:hypothetical protein
MAGVNSHASIRVSYAPRWVFLMNFPRDWLEYKRCERRSGRRIKQRVYSQTAKAG